MAEPIRTLKDSFGQGEWPATAPKELGQRSEVSAAMKDKARLVRTLYAGTEAMRDATTEFLPKEPGESTEAYDHRLNRTFLYNGIGRTIQVLAGKPFARPIQVGDDVPEAIAEWCENIDNTGRDINVFARDLFIDGLLDGISYFLVEMLAEVKDEEGNVVPLNKAQGDKRGKRVYWVQYSADEILGWKSEIRGGRPFLTQVRLKTSMTRSVDEYTEEEVEGVLVLIPGGWATYRLVVKEDQSGNTVEETFVLVDSGKTSLPFIPLVPIYTKRADFMAGSPPLRDLGDLNLAHWQSSSDQRHILHISRVPILFAKGWNLPPGEKVELGPNRLLTQESAAAELSYVEITGAGLEAGQKDLENLKEEMGDLAMRLLVPKTGDVTATQTGIEAAEAHSALQAMAESLQNSLEVGLAYTAALAGLTQGGGSLKVHTDFGIAMHDSEIGRLLADAEAKGQVSKETLWAEWRRRNILSDAFDEKIEEERLEKNKPEPETGGTAAIAQLLAGGGNAPAGPVPSEGAGGGTERVPTE